jgi:hypothetical protein
VTTVLLRPGGNHAYLHCQGIITIIIQDGKGIVVTLKNLTPYRTEKKRINRTSRISSSSMSSPHRKLRALPPEACCTRRRMARTSAALAAPSSETLAPLAVLQNGRRRLVAGSDEACRLQPHVFHIAILQRRRRGHQRRACSMARAPKMGMQHHHPLLQIQQTAIVAPRLALPCSRRRPSKACSGWHGEETKGIQKTERERECCRRRWCGRLHRWRRHELETVGAKQRRL